MHRWFLIVIIKNHKYYIMHSWTWEFVPQSCWPSYSEDNFTGNTPIPHTSHPCYFHRFTPPGRPLHCLLYLSLMEFKLVGVDLRANRNVIPLREKLAQFYHPLVFNGRCPLKDSFCAWRVWSSVSVFGCWLVRTLMYLNWVLAIHLNLCFKPSTLWALIKIHPIEAYGKNFFRYSN